MHRRVVDDRRLEQGDWDIVHHKESTGAPAGCGLESGRQVGGPAHPQSLKLETQPGARAHCLPHDIKMTGIFRVKQNGDAGHGGKSLLEHLKSLRSLVFSDGTQTSDVSNGAGDGWDWTS